MVHARSTRIHLLAALLVALVADTATVFAIPIDGGVEGPTPDVFYNFYVPPVPAGAAPGMGAQLYVSPRPVPPRVGHTWHTYPPFMPHEFLYKHRRRYIRPAGVTGMRTDVKAYWY
ncbi:MAG: hypothetical protein K8S94_17635 [Planctomycetia bacterium]|nr:hypothetical protein [Planctomycetia bacterium]